MLNLLMEPDNVWIRIRCNQQYVTLVWTNGCYILFPDRLVITRPLMAFVGFPEILVASLCFAALCYWNRWCRSRNGNGRSPLTNWPVVGMLPGLLRNANRIHEFVTEVLKAGGGTFEFKGPCFGNIDMLVTSDPANIHHILSKNFTNYPKGPQFNKIFDIFGDGIFNSDFDLWRIHRATTMPLINSPTFFSFLVETSWHKVDKGLLPVLDRASELVTEVDLQDLFQRFSFDTICVLLLGHDPSSLCVDLPWVPCEKGFVDTEKATMQRHLLPESCWKLQRWLRIGQEKKLSEAWLAFDRFISSCTKQKREQLGKSKSDQGCGLLPAFIDAYGGESGGSGDPEKFLRDTILSLMLAGRGTTSSALTWFFWLLSKNPSAENNIREEIRTKLLNAKGNNLRSVAAEEWRKLVYLHGALCEALRLYPPVSLEHKAPLEEDTLPSGHRIGKNTKAVLSFYSMGRMEAIWGKDCLEFKPERWISERGATKHEPSYKFPAFNAGPRSCLGKEMSFIQMKIVAAAILCSYRIHVVEDQPICPSDSVVLSMKHGLKVKVTNASSPI